MINQIQTIRTFVERQLVDLAPHLVIDRGPSGQEIANGDRASAVVATRLGGRHRIVLTSAYVEPPLGRVVMTNLATLQIIAGNKSDAMWSAIETHIRGSKDEPGPTVVPVAAEAPAALPFPGANPDGRAPHLGQGVTFYTQRGEPVGGMMKLAAIVTEIHGLDEVSLTVFPRTGEQFWRNNIKRRTPDNQFYCWDFSDAQASATVVSAAPAQQTPHMLYLPEGYEAPAEFSTRPDEITWLKRRGPGRPKAVA